MQDFFFLLFVFIFILTCLSLSNLNLRKYLVVALKIWTLLFGAVSVSRSIPVTHARALVCLKAVSDMLISCIHKSPQSFFHVPVVTVKELFKSNFTSHPSPTVSLSLWHATKTVCGIRRTVRGLAHTHTHVEFDVPWILNHAAFRRLARPCESFWSPEGSPWLGPCCVDDEEGKECGRVKAADTRLLWR